MLSSLRQQNHFRRVLLVVASGGVILLGGVIASYILIATDPLTLQKDNLNRNQATPNANKRLQLYGSTVDTSQPSGMTKTNGHQPDWRQVFVDEFSSPLKKEWTAYDGQYGDSAHSWAKKSHVYTADDLLHIAGKMDYSSPSTPQWFNGGACLCSTLAEDQSWLDVKDVMVSFRWRVVNTNLTSVAPPKYAFLRWPQSETWPRDGEEDFLEGYLEKSAGYEFTSHAAGPDGKDFNAYWKRDDTYDPTAWHTITYIRNNYRMQLLVDGQTRVDHLGSERDAPNTPKHIVFQQVCDRTTACPTDGSSVIQLDWVVVSIPE